ncbi:MAG: PadR family transcriptional regulator [Gemmatimonadota bacterium]
MKEATSNLPILKGTLDMLVLKALSGGPMHGFGIALWLEQHSTGQLELDDSLTYQVLHRLEGRGLIDAEWRVTSKNRRARLYTLNRAGHDHLGAEFQQWLRFSSVVTGIMTQTLHPHPG